jgi:glycolate oxidase iron-sulfur subunit
MQTHFTTAQLADPHLREADSILRTCVHCGFCLSNCPTYALLGDERDSPRGRIYLIKDMLEGGGPARAATVTHIDRCLSCLGCLTACPSGVDYMHLVDQARAHIEETYRRPLFERVLRQVLLWIIPRPALFRVMLLVGWPFRVLAPLVPGRIGRLLATMPRRFDSPSPIHAPQVFPAEGPHKKRVALLTGCVQTVLGTRINEATIRVLRRHGCDVVVAKGAACCGALPQHMGRVPEAQAFARANVRAWTAAGIDAVAINASGCGTTVKDYGHLLADDPAIAEAARAIAAKTKDVTELLVELGAHRTIAAPRGVAVAYHDSCSLQHGQRVTREPRALLANAGFSVREVAEAQYCCGAAGTYNILQPAISDALAQRKTGNLLATGAQAMACANLGCMLHLGRFSDLPMVHTIELLDWAGGGPIPEALVGRPASSPAS